MERLNKKEGVLYTQIAEDLPIEERVFFKEGIGGEGFTKNYRIATAEEIEQYEEYQRKQEDEHQTMMDEPTVAEEELPA